MPCHNVSIISGTYEEVMNSDESYDYIKVIITDKYISLEMLENLRSLFPNLMAVEGKNFSTENEISTLSMRDLKDMSPEKILEKFFIETFGDIPLQSQTSEFLELLSQSEEEDRQ